VNKFLLQVKYYTLYVALAAGLYSFFITPAASKENILGLDDRTKYDIYLGNENGFGIIKSVEIADVRELFNKTFLVIRTDTFDSRASEGLIALEAIQAILPAHRAVFMQSIGQINQ
jgi:hypothetical protein